MADGGVSATGWHWRRLTASACGHSFMLGFHSDLFQQLAGRPLAARNAGEEDTLVVADGLKTYQLKIRAYRTAPSTLSMLLRGADFQAWVLDHCGQPGDVMAFKRNGQQLAVRHVPAAEAVPEFPAPAIPAPRQQAEQPAPEAALPARHGTLVALPALPNSSRGAEDCLLRCFKLLLPSARASKVALEELLGDAPPYNSKEQGPCEYLQQLLQWGAPVGSDVSDCIVTGSSSRGGSSGGGGGSRGGSRVASVDLGALHAAGCFPHLWRTPLQKAEVAAANKRGAVEWAANPGAVVQAARRPRLQAPSRAADVPAPPAAVAAATAPASDGPAAELERGAPHSAHGCRRQRDGGTADLDSSGKRRRTQHKALEAPAPVAQRQELQQQQQRQQQQQQQQQQAVRPMGPPPPQQPIMLSAAPQQVEPPIHAPKLLQRPSQKQPLQPPAHQQQRPPEERQLAGRQHQQRPAVRTTSAASAALAASLLTAGKALLSPPAAAHEAQQVVTGSVRGGGPSAPRSTAHHRRQDPPEAAPARSAVMLNSSSNVHRGTAAAAAAEGNVVSRLAGPSQPAQDMSPQLPRAAAAAAASSGGQSADTTAARERSRGCLVQEALQAAKHISTSDPEDMLQLLVLLALAHPDCPALQEAVDGWGGFALAQQRRLYHAAHVAASGSRQQLQRSLRLALKLKV